MYRKAHLEGTSAGLMRGWVKRAYVVAAGARGQPAISRRGRLVSQPVGDRGPEQR